VIIGNGLIAKAFKSKFEHEQAVTIFASGVSNSSEVRESAFQRERRLLLETIDKSTGVFVYFSTCSLTDPDRQSTPYVEHKAEAEKLLEEISDSMVFRLPQVVGRTNNPHTLTNFLASRILRSEPFTIWKSAIRTLIDVDDVAEIGSVLIERGVVGKTIDLCTPESVTMVELVLTMERVLCQHGQYSAVDRGGGSHPDATLAHHVAAELGIDFSGGYTERVLRKYYGEHQWP
jgi:nucleoside-diphosphate-sugar epimerase